MYDVHPTSTGGDGKVVPRRTTPQPGDVVQDILHCAYCGLPFRVGKDTEGNSTESPGISYATNSATGTNFLRNGDFQTWSLGTSFTDRPEPFTVADGWDIVENGITASNSISKDSTVLLNSLSSLRLELNMNFINVFTVSASPTTMITGGTYLVPTNSLTVTLNMPAAAANTYFIVRDIGNNASVNNITLHRAGSESIDGTAADKTLSTNNGQWLIISDGTNWYTILNAGLTVGTQTIAGVKTFSSSPAVSIAGSASFQVTGASSATGYGDQSVQIGLKNSNATANNTVAIVVTDNTFGTPAASLEAKFTDRTSHYAEWSFLTRSAGGYASCLTIAASGCIIKGTNTNDSAASGNVGEYIESVSGTIAAPTSGQYKDVTSISLTAGDWDVTLIAHLDNNSATGTAYRVGITATTGNSSTGINVGENSLDLPLNNSGLGTSSATVASYRVSLASTTIYYFKWFASYTGAPTMKGRLSARRIR